MRRKLVLARLRFAQRYENWTIDDQKHVIFSGETKFRFDSYGRSWRWIWDGERIWPQHVHQTLKHAGGPMQMYFRKKSCGPLYKIRIWIQVDWSCNRIMIPSTRARSCKNVWHHNNFNSFNGLQILHIWISLNTYGHFSNNAWTNLRHLLEVFKNYRSICVRCIPIWVNKIAWRFMRICHEEFKVVLKSRGY